MATIHFTLGQPNGQGLCPIILKYITKQDSFQHPIDEYIKPQAWDGEQQRVSETEKGCSRNQRHPGNGKK